MVISYHGGEFFKITFGDTTVALNPISKESKLKGAKFGADIALVTLNHPDMNGVGQVSHGDREPFVISGAGEYEVKKTVVRGLPATSSYGGKEGINTIYVVTLEGIHLCFLGALSTRKLGSEIKGALPDIDVLFVPIGGGGVLTASEAHELAVELEPKVIIPMHYGEGMEEKPGTALKSFLKTGGSNGKPIDKLTLKKRDLEGKSGEIIILGQ